MVTQSGNFYDSIVFTTSRLLLEKRKMADFVLNSCDALIRKFSDFGIVITGNFNILATS